MISSLTLSACGVTGNQSQADTAVKSEQNTDESAGGKSAEAQKETTNSTENAESASPDATDKAGLAATGSGDIAAASAGSTETAAASAGTAEKAKAGDTAAAPAGSTEAAASVATGDTAAASAETGDTVSAETAAEIPAEIETSIDNIDKYGDIILKISTADMQALGYEIADIITVKINDFQTTMPIGSKYSDVYIGAPICCFHLLNPQKKPVTLAISSGSLGKEAGLGEYRKSDDDSGDKWIYPDGLEMPVTVHISMFEKQGYAEQFELYHVEERTNNREDYADLSDAEYANFRVVDTGGMGKNALFRSSTPVSPQLNRNREADQALLDSGIRAIVNTSDSKDDMLQYEGYDQTNYSKCNILNIGMGVDFDSEDCRSKFAEGFRFMASNDGPYLIHCIEGMVRTGYMIAILESLMGASADEIDKDYALSYHNFFGVEPGSEKFKHIAAQNIDKILANTFGIDSIHDDSADLQACAKTYLTGLGLTEEEIDDLVENLSKDYEGMPEGE